MVATPILDDYLPDEQLASLYRKSVRTLKRWRREGKAPPSIPWGNKWLTHVEDAKAHIEALRQDARAANGAKRRAR